ncbi:MAG TPA: hypothetical protein VG013_08275 [Gemmataceae bacterium]|nr:hypothetical protein [Gemmataceae bacterium]
MPATTPQASLTAPRQEQLPLASGPAVIPPAAASADMGLSDLDRHLARLHELLRLQTAEAQASARRRGRQPTDRQRLQQFIRQAAVDCYHAWHAQGLTLEQVSGLMNLSARTLRYWDHGCRPETIALVPVGRPLERSALPVRQEILAYLKLTGPGVGVPTLQEHFVDVARAELANLLQRYRVVCRARHRQLAHVLHWQTPGRVWAADFTEPSLYGSVVLPPIAGRYPYVLAVRDLASGSMLAWQPIPDLTAEVARAELARLFALHGAPLVLKVDKASSRTWCPL